MIALVVLLFLEKLGTLLTGCVQHCVQTVSKIYRKHTAEPPRNAVRTRLVSRDVNIILRETFGKNWSQGCNYNKLHSKISGAGEGN